tara:strand:+ start:2591 stop:3445 length:855 start_codon:yes stop_codon:yes gene_type:complete
MNWTPPVMHKTRFLLLLSFLMISMPFAQVWADTVLFFAPTRVEIIDQKPVQEIRITNMSNIARSYSVSLKNLAMDENGHTARVDTFDYSAKRMLRFVPRQFDIKPGEKQIIRIMARFPEGTQDGEYHAHLEFLENISKRAELNKEASPENQAKAKAQIAYATAIPVVISKGAIKTDIAVHNIVVGKDGKSGRPNISMVLDRSGNGQGNALIEADYIAPDGTEKKAAVRRSVFIYREIDQRKHAFILELLDQKDIQNGGKIRVKLFNKNISESTPVDTVLVPVSH